MINAYIQAHDLVGVVVVADAAMLSAKTWMHLMPRVLTTLLLTV
nr:hypothetical protein [Corynebacterium cystitidis]